MLKEGNKITVHFIDHCRHPQPTEEKTGYTGKIYTVKKEGNKLGFDGNEKKSPYTCGGNVFTPFSAYAWSVIFKDTETGNIYRCSSIHNELEDVTGLEDGYINKIKWL